MIVSIYSAMKKAVEKTLDRVPLELLSISTGESANEETGVITKFVKCEVDVPRGFDDLSRCRFTVKITDGKLKLTDDDLVDAEYNVNFYGLLISYIDNRGTVYAHRVCGLAFTESATLLQFRHPKKGYEGIYEDWMRHLEKYSFAIRITSSLERISLFVASIMGCSVMP